MFAYFHISGKVPSFKDLLNSFDRGYEMLFAVSLRSLLLIRSGPVALDMFSEFRTLKVSCGSIVILSILASVAGVKSGNLWLIGGITLFVQKICH